MKTAIINSDLRKHFTGDGHPEQPKRVIAIKDKLKKEMILSGKNQKKARKNIGNDTFKGLHQ